MMTVFARFMVLVVAGPKLPSKAAAAAGCETYGQTSSEQTDLTSVSVKSERAQTPAGRVVKVHTEQCLLLDSIAENDSDSDVRQGRYNCPVGLDCWLGPSAIP